MLQHARCADAAEILALYRAAIGKEFCAWDETYPTEREIAGDLASAGLFIVREEGRIIGAVSVVPENELDGMKEWQVQENVREIARVVVAESARGRGLAAQMVGEILEALKASRVCAVHLSAAVGNVPALKTYERLGFLNRGAAELYGGKYFLMEKILTDNA